MEVATLKSGQPVVIGDLDGECEGLALEDVPQPGLLDHQVPGVLLQQVQRPGGALVKCTIQDIFIKKPSLHLKYDPSTLSFVSVF